MLACPGAQWTQCIHCVHERHTTQQCSVQYKSENCLWDTIPRRLSGGHFGMCPSLHLPGCVTNKPEYLNEQNFITIVASMSGHQPSSSEGEKVKERKRRNGDCVLNVLATHSIHATPATANRWQTFLRTSHPSHVRQRPNIEHSRLKNVVHVPNTISHKIPVMLISLKTTKP